MIDPTTREIALYRDGAFHPYRPQSRVLPAARSSVDWYRGWRDHLEFAEIGGAAEPPFWNPESGILNAGQIPFRATNKNES